MVQRSPCRLGLYKANGKENGSYYLGFWGLGFRPSWRFVGLNSPLLTGPIRLVLTPLTSLVEVAGVVDEPKPWVLPPQLQLDNNYNIVIYSP